MSGTQNLAVAAKAEQETLGALLIAPDLADTVPRLVPEHFDDPRHRLILGALRRVLDEPDTNRADQTAVNLSLLDELRRRGELDRAGGGAYLHALHEACESPMALGYSSRIVVEAAQRRMVRRARTKLEQVEDTPADWQQFVDSALPVLEDLLRIVTTEPTAAEGHVDGVWNVEDFVAQVDEDQDTPNWLIPWLLERMDRVITVASEGAGKSVLSRQVALCASQGRHPLMPSVPIAPRRALIVDLENPPGIVRRSLRRLMGNVAAYAGGWTDGMVRLVSWPAGLDLRKPADAALLDRVVGEFRPGILCLGPLYKAFASVGGEQSDQVAGDVTRVLDRLRVKHNCALWLEHHAPFAQAGRQRDMRPFGSTVWSRWPEFGLGLRFENPRDLRNRTLVVERFRGDRDERAWPDKLLRGSAMPWEPSWDDGIPRDLAAAEGTHLRWDTPPRETA